MLFHFSEEDERLRDEIRAFLDQEFPPERQIKAIAEQHENQDHIDLEWERSFRRQLGARGWLGLGIPQEYGGSGGTALQRHIFASEMSYYGAPYPRNPVQVIAPAIMAYGSEELKHHFLPLIARGEINISFGYTEPEAGTDLASLRTRARRDGDDYVISGQKIFTTRAHRAEYVYLAARTSTDGKPHDGISLFLVPLSDPNVVVEQLPVLGGRTNITYYDNVRIPALNLIGQENEGWLYLRHSLGLERLGVFPVGHIRRLVEELTAEAHRPLPDGTVPIESPSVRQSVADVQTDLALLQALTDGALVEIFETGNLQVHVAAQIKTFLTEFKQRIADIGMEIFGPYGQLTEDSSGAPLDGLMEEMWRDAIVHTYGAGANEVQRDMIAARGLGLPRSR